jgi:DNA-binding transcriptional LysR family regulator
MTQPRISLEQWRALLTVVDAGGYAQAAVAMHKSQSAVTYAVQKLEALLGVKVFSMVGRKAHLTPAGEVLYRRAKALLDEAGALEGAAGSLGAGWESELRIAAEIIFPTWLLLQSLARFAEERPQTRIEVYESVLSGTEEALLQRKVDLAICSQVPQGFIGDLLMPIRFIAAAHPSHALFQLGRELTTQDLRKHCHLLIRDTGSRRRAGGELGAERSWTVSQKATSIHAAVMGMGFAWFPEDTVRGELERGELKALPLREGGDRWANLYLVFADRDYAGPGAVRLAAIIREHVADQCRLHAASGAGQYSLNKSNPSMRESSL